MIYLNHKIYLEAIIMMIVIQIFLMIIWPQKIIELNIEDILKKEN